MKSKKIFSETVKKKKEIQKNPINYGIFRKDFPLQKRTLALIFSLSTPFIFSYTFQYIWKERLSQDYKDYLSTLNLSISGFYGLSVR